MPFHLAPLVMPIVMVFIPMDVRLQSQPRQIVGRVERLALLPMAVRLAPLGLVQSALARRDSLIATASMQMAAREP